MLRQKSCWEYFWLIKLWWHHPSDPLVFWYCILIMNNREMFPYLGPIKVCVANVACIVTMKISNVWLHSFHCWHESLNTIWQLISHQRQHCTLHHHYMTWHKIIPSLFSPIVHSNINNTNTYLLTVIQLSILSFFFILIN